MSEATTSAKRVAAIYDIHGNLPALEAVLEDMRQAGVEVTHRRRTAVVSKISGNLATSLEVGAKMFYTLARERLR